MPGSDIIETRYVSERRVRRLWYMLWAGIVWSLIYTAVGIFLMVGMTHQLQDSCHQRQQARTALRTVILNDPDTDAADIAQLNDNLPIQVTC